jgi:hypothetical protein
MAGDMADAAQALLILRPLNSHFGRAMSAAHALELDVVLFGSASDPTPLAHGVVCIEAWVNGHEERVHHDDVLLVLSCHTGGNYAGGVVSMDRAAYMYVTTVSICACRRTFGIGHWSRVCPGKATW